MNFKQVKYCRENLVYKIFGLFPFYEYDSNGNLELCKGNTRVDGCYDQIACSFRLPDGVSLTVQETEILSEGRTYGYGTLIRCYRKYSRLKDNPFIRWMNRGIGIINVPAGLRKPECDLIPDFVYQCECSSLLDEMIKLSIACANYHASGESNCEMECLCEKYDRMGGDDMLSFYRQQADAADGIATEYLGYVDGYSDFRIQLNITQTMHDLGAVENYIDLWNPYTSYRRGDIVSYDGHSYVCLEDGASDISRFMRVGKLFSALSMVDTDSLSSRICVFTGGPEDKYVWNPYDTYGAGDALTFNGRTYLCSDVISDVDVSTDGDGNYVFGNVTVPVVVNYDIRLTGETNSRLRSFRKYEDYISTLGQVETPGLHEDWLYYYKKGYLASSNVIRDEIGNIDILPGKTRNTDIGEYETNLSAYGDILVDIGYSEDDHSVTFTYVCNGHLKAKLVNITADEDGNVIYHYGEFAYDETDSYHGVKYVESYTYEPDGEIDQLIRDGKFNLYVETVSFTTPSTVGLEYVKGAFSTLSTIQIGDAFIGGNHFTFNYQPAAFTTVVSSDRDITSYPVIREDYYDGMAYPTIVDNHIAFSRGNAAAFERHIKLGEVKSFDDFMNYANGGFFNVR